MAGKPPSVTPRLSSCRAADSQLCCPEQAAPRAGRRHSSLSAQGAAARRLTKGYRRTWGKSCQQTCLCPPAGPTSAWFELLVWQQPYGCFTKRAEVLPQVQEQREQSSSSWQGPFPPQLCTPRTGPEDNPSAQLPPSLPGSGHQAIQRSGFFLTAALKVNMVNSAGTVAVNTHISSYPHISSSLASLFQKFLELFYRP